MGGTNGVYQRKQGIRIGYQKCKGPSLPPISVGLKNNTWRPAANCSYPDIAAHATTGEERKRRGRSHMVSAKIWDFWTPLLLLSQSHSCNLSELSSAFESTPLSADVICEWPLTTILATRTSMEGEFARGPTVTASPIRHHFSIYLFPSLSPPPTE